jgi:hypothetical protein
MRSLMLRYLTDLAFELHLELAGADRLLERRELGDGESHQAISSAGGRGELGEVLGGDHPSCAALP